MLITLEASHHTKMRMRMFLMHKRYKMHASRCL